MATAKKILDKKPTEIPGNVSAKKGALVVSNAVSLDAKTPIPLDYDSDWHTNQKGKRYIPFLNPTDNFAKTLLEARMISITANACITTKALYCIGKGLRLTNGVDIPELTEWKKSVNKHEESLEDIAQACFENVDTFGNCYVKVTRVKIAGSKYLRVTLLNTQDVRLLSPGEDADSDFPTAVAISKEFRSLGFWSMRKNAYLELPLYTSDNLFRKWGKDGNDESVVIHIKNKVAGYDFYGMPSNVSGLTSEVLEYKAARYNLDEFDNNMVVGGVLMLSADLSPEEATKIGKRITETHTGDGKRGRVIVLAGEDLGTSGKYESHESSREGSFIESDKHNEDKIITANQWDAMLAGLRRDSGLGNGGSGYIQAVYEIKKETVIAPAQKRILDKLISPIMSMAAEWFKNDWNKYPFEIIAKPPVSFASEVDVNSVITIDEGRSLLGKDPMQDNAKGSRIISEIKQSKNPLEAGINVQN